MRKYNCVSLNASFVSELKVAPSPLSAGNGRAFFDVNILASHHGMVGVQKRPPTMGQGWPPCGHCECMCELKVTMDGGSLSWTTHCLPLAHLLVQTSNSIYLQMQIKCVSRDRLGRNAGKRLPRRLFPLHGLLAINHPEVCTTRHNADGKSNSMRRRLGLLDCARIRQTCEFLPLKARQDRTMKATHRRFSSRDNRANSASFARLGWRVSPLISSGIHAPSPPAGLTMSLLSRNCQ